MNSNLWTKVNTKSIYHYLSSFLPSEWGGFLHKLQTTIYMKLKVQIIKLLINKIHNQMREHRWWETIFDSLILLSNPIIQVKTWYVYIIHPFYMIKSYLQMENLKFTNLDKIPQILELCHFGQICFIPPLICLNLFLKLR